MLVEEVVNCDVAKEFLTVLAYCDDSFMKCIPQSILFKLRDLAADSLKDFYLDKNKALGEQNISDECKDLIGYMYFMYMVNSDSKKEVLNVMLENIDSINT